MSTAQEPTLGRRERRKRETHRRLLEAAHELIAEGGVATLRIGDVSARAEVGFGTFYSYFQSKRELIEAVVASTMATAAQAIGARAAAVEDPAEAAALSYRRFVGVARDDPEVARVLVALGGAEELFESALLPYARATIERGVVSGRFVVEDVELALASVSAMALAAIRGVLEDRFAPGAAEHGAALLLRALGLPPEEAAAVARRPLPQIDLIIPQGISRPG